MSNKQNTEWLEGMYEGFQEALDEENWDRAQDIIDEVHDNGFYPESQRMEKDLAEAQTK